MSAQTAFTEPADVRPPHKRNPADGPISCNRLTGSLKEAANWPGAALNTVVTLATALVAARAEEEGSSYFQNLSERDRADATAQALAGFFQVRAGHLCSPPALVSSDCHPCRPVRTRTSPLPDTKR